MILKRFKRPSWMLISFTTAILLIDGLESFYSGGIWVAEADRPGKVDVIVCLNGPERVKKAAELTH